MLCYLKACKGSLGVKEAVLGIAILVRWKSLPDARNLMYSIAEEYPHARRILEALGVGLALQMSDEPSFLHNETYKMLSTLEGLLISKVPRLASEEKKSKLMAERNNFYALGFGVSSLVVLSDVMATLADILVDANCYVGHDFTKNHVLKGVYTETYSD